MYGDYIFEVENIFSQDQKINLSFFSQVNDPLEVSLYKEPNEFHKSINNLFCALLDKDEITLKNDILETSIKEQVCNYYGKFIIFCGLNKYHEIIQNKNYFYENLEKLFFWFENMNEEDILKLRKFYSKQIKKNLMK